MMDPLQPVDRMLLDSIAATCREFQRELDAGREPRIEDCLSNVQPVHQPAYLRALLATELKAIRARGVLPSVDAYLERFPSQQPIVLEVFLRQWTSFPASHSQAEGGTEVSQSHLAETVGLEVTRTFYPPTVRDQEQASGLQGSLFGDYELLSPIARGGMGIVYKARQRRLNRIVALKMILGGEMASEEQVRRFYAEAEAAAKLDHPGIVPVYEVGRVGSQHFYSMAYVEGSSLSAELNHGPFPAREAARQMVAVALAIQYAHERGVIHRDLKPQNVLLDREGCPRVTDFGLARNVAVDSTLTATGQIMGTPGYMPPEQALGRIDQIRPASDVYSLGATLYHLLTGRPPFRAATPMDTIWQVLQTDPVPPRHYVADLPRDLETICLKCLQKPVERRYGSAREFAEDLQRFLKNEPILARPVSRWERLAKWARRRPAVAALLSACVVAGIGYGLVGWYWYRNRPERVRAEAEKANAIADLRTAEAEKLSAEAERLQREREKSALDADKSRLELQREAQKGLDVKHAWSELVLRVQAINDQHTQTETRIVNRQPQRSGYGITPSTPGRPGRIADSWGNPVGGNSPLDRLHDPFGGMPGFGGRGIPVGPFDPVTGQPADFDMRTGQWRSRNEPSVQLDRYIVVTDSYRNAVQKALEQSVESLSLEERRQVYWNEYVEPNRAKYFKHLEKLPEFEALRTRYRKESTDAQPPP